MQDQRTDPRVPLIAAAEVTEVATGTRLSARTSDVSRTGCYIATRNATPAKTEVRERATGRGDVSRSDCYMRPVNPTPDEAGVRVPLSHNGEELDAPARVRYVSPGLGL